MKMFKQWVFLSVTALFAILWIFLFQPYVLSDELNLLSAKTSLLDEWRDTIMWYSQIINYLISTIFTVIWIIQGANFKAENSRKTLDKLKLWWFFAIISTLINLSFLLFLSYILGFIDQTGFYEFLLWLAFFAIVDVLVAFWLPTAIATPRTMRYLPPGSRLLRSIYGG